MDSRRDAQRKAQAIAYRQSGYLTARQALEAGYTYQAQKYHLDHGNWLRVERGIFRLRDWPATVDDTYVLWSLWSGGRGVVSHASALAAHDLGVVDPVHVHLTVPPGFRARHPAVLTHPGVLPPDDVEERDGFRVTTAPRTLLDVASMRDVTQETVDAAVADALALGTVAPGSLRSRADELGDRAALRIERALNSVGR